MVLLRILLLLIPVSLFAQTGFTPYPAKSWFKDTVLMTKQLKINSTGGAIIGGYNKNADAILELSSTTKTFLPPRMTAVQRLAISPTAGAIVYDTDSSKVCVYSSSWTCLSNTGGGGATNGNGTTVNGTAVDIRGNLNRAATEISMDMTNQYFAWFDTSVNGYGEAVGDFYGNGAPVKLFIIQSLYGEVDTFLIYSHKLARILGENEGVKIIGLGQNYNSILSLDSIHYLLSASSARTHSNIMGDTNSIACRVGSVDSATPKFYIDVNKVQRGSIRMGSGVGRMFDTATLQMFVDIGLDSGVYIRGKDESSRAFAVKDSAEAIKFAAYADGSLIIRDGNEGAGKVLTSDASGVGSWQPNHFTDTTGAWSIVGNAGLTDGVDNFDGTNDNVAKRFILNGQYSGRLDADVGSDSFGYNCFLGYRVGQINIPDGSNGKQNTAFGWQSFTANNIGSRNTAFGYSALYQSTLSRNSAFGAGALESLQNGEDNTAVGDLAGTLIVDGINNTLIGSSATNTGDVNNTIALGYQANALSSNEFAIGTQDHLNFELNGATVGYVLTCDAANSQIWKPNTGANVEHDSIAITGATVTLSNNTIQVIAALTTITDVTLAFPSGAENDQITVIFQYPVTTLTVSGTGSGTIKQTVAAVGSRVFKNFGGNWY